MKKLLMMIIFITTLSGCSQVIEKGDKEFQLSNNKNTLTLEIDDETHTYYLQSSHIYSNYTVYDYGEYEAVYIIETDEWVIR